MAPESNSQGLSIRAYAAHRRAKGLRGGTRAAVEKALGTGRIKKNRSGKIDPNEADSQWEQSTRMEATAAEPAPARAQATQTSPNAAAEPAPTGPSYGQSRAVREAYQARLARLDYEERTGQLVRIDEIRVKTFQKTRQARDRILTIPRRIAAELAADTDPRSVEERLEEELRMALEDLSHE